MRSTCERRLGQASRVAMSSVSSDLQSITTIRGTRRACRSRAGEDLLRASLNGNGRFREALSAADDAVREAASRLGDLKHSSLMGQALLELAMAKQGLGDVKGARDDIATALEHLSATPGPRSSEVARAAVVRRSLT
jgi:hypothetical protein